MFPGTAKPGKNLIRNEQDAILAADGVHSCKISLRRRHSSHRGSNNRLGDKGSNGFRPRFYNRGFKFLEQVLYIFVFGKPGRPSVIIGRRDVREIVEPFAVEFATG